MDVLLTLDEVEWAIRASWAQDTCSPDDLERSGWQPSNPAWGHCDVTTLVVNDLFGGDLVMCEVYLDGQRQGYHWWNQLGAGFELDLTRSQFILGQTLTGATVRQRPPGPLHRHEVYQLFRSRVFTALSKDDRA